MLDTSGKSLEPSAYKAKGRLTRTQMSELRRFGERVSKFGVNFAVCNTDGELALFCDGGKFKSEEKLIIENCSEFLIHSSEDKNYDPAAEDCISIMDNQFLVTALRSASRAVGAAVIDLGEKVSDSNSVSILQETQNTGLGAELIEKEKCALTTNSYILKEVLSEMLGLLAEKFQVSSGAEEQIGMVSAELAHVYEELVLLHRLSTNMRINEPDSHFLQMACDSLTDIVLVEGIAVLLKKVIDSEEQLVVTAGSGLIDIDERMAVILYSRLAEQIRAGKEALLDSEVDSPFRYDWPESVKSIIAVPLCGKDKNGAHFAEKLEDNNSIMGLMVAVNRIDKPDFDSIDLKLFNSVANSCAVFIENGRLFGDLKELFIGSLKALTSSIDAKDKYTRGHSERVAFISRWIAERFAERGSLKEEQIHRSYLAGLLHDIGKMGIDETVLRKEGKLTEQECNSIRMHPSIGSGILHEIKQMRDIVPGVLCHHERADGKGYPNGLVAEQIPLIGKIVGLADSFDAMTSQRTYRGAMSVEEALAEIEKGLGTQFDEEVGRVFLDSDVYHLWDIIQDGFVDAYGNGDFAEYGTVAVGTLIR